MLLVYFVIAAIPIGYILGGRLKNYLNDPLKLVFFPCIAFLIEASFGKIGEMTGLPPEKWLWIAVCAEYLFLALFIVANRKSHGAKLLGLATFVNFMVIAVNGFRMPISPLIHNYPDLLPIVEMVQSGALPEYVLVDWNGPLWFLGDTIPVSGGLASVGDIIMGLAILIIIVGKMKAKPAETDEKTAA